ncbi:hypothetical protein SISSUDRAFT_181581 [Sistotremastrum suecicum HHB10207 ss-3]|uniref:Uncharacterized protein n=1 Tax=Sistotremastrum suecicum HHB10207 ss-3 TaxID=1314776 RepID=A0A166GSK9_9AGAM|nr:hypothetical protein SISSUDRAFT_181581 [Sistotremastrum suecicum HHB10207 ss-3]
MDKLVSKSLRSSSFCALQICQCDDRRAIMRKCRRQSPSGSGAFGYADLNQVQFYLRRSGKSTEASLRPIVPMLKLIPPTLVNRGLQTIHTHSLGRVCSPMKMVEKPLASPAFLVGSGDFRSLQNPFFVRLTVDWISCLPTLVFEHEPIRGECLTIARTTADKRISHRKGLTASETS